MQTEQSNKTLHWHAILILLLVDIQLKTKVFLFFIWEPRVWCMNVMYTSNCQIWHSHQAQSYTIDFHPRESPVWIENLKQIQYEFELSSTWVSEGRARETQFCSFWAERCNAKPWKWLIAWLIGILKNMFFNRMFCLVYFAWFQLQLRTC